MADPQVITRFAPSPTGLLHLGHLYAAHFARDLAIKSGGRFLLRFEDIDTTRVRKRFYHAIENDLTTAGIQWHGTPIKQTDRLDVYATALEKLKKLDVVYPCFCTRKDIQRELKHLTQAPHTTNAAHYPGTCRNLPKKTIQELSKVAIPCWRLHTAKAKQLIGDLTFTDSIHGTISVEPELLGDTVLARKDIGTSYHIAVVVDDAFQNITDVTRGKDLLESTHLHRILQHLLDFPEPRYHHHDLVCDKKGNRLAKRDHALALQTLMQSGHSAESLRKIALQQLD